MESIEKEMILIEERVHFGDGGSRSIYESESYRSEYMASRAKEYRHLLETHDELRHHLAGTEHYTVPRYLTEHSLTEAWTSLTHLNDQRSAATSPQKTIIQVGLTNTQKPLCFPLTCEGSSGGAAGSCAAFWWFILKSPGDATACEN